MMPICYDGFLFVYFKHHAKKIGTIKLMFTIFPLHVKLMIFIPRVQINSLGKFKFSVKHDIFIHRTTRYCRLHINN